MKVTLFGGTGFVGSHLMRALRDQGHHITLFSRRSVPVSEGVNLIVGEINETAKLTKALHETETVIYCIGIIRDNPRRGITYEKAHVSLLQRIIDQAAKQKVGHFILLSANGIASARTPYQRTKLAGEAILKASGIPWTIIRPSLIFGPPEGHMEFSETLAKQIIKPYLPAPLFFHGCHVRQAGHFRFSPVHVGDVARIVVTIVRSPAPFSSRALCVGGPESLTWRQIIGRIAAACHRRKWLIPVPVWLLWPVLVLLDRFPWFPITRDQLTLLLAGNDCARDTPWQEFDIEPLPFHSEHFTWLS